MPFFFARLLNFLVCDLFISTSCRNIAIKQIKNLFYKRYPIRINLNFILVISVILRSRITINIPHSLPITNHFQISTDFRVNIVIGHKVSITINTILPMMIVSTIMALPCQFKSRVINHFARNRIKMLTISTQLCCLQPSI